MFAGGLMSRNVGLRRISSERKPTAKRRTGDDGIWNPLQSADNLRKYRNWPTDSTECLRKVNSTFYNINYASNSLLIFNKALKRLYELIFIERKRRRRNRTIKIVIMPPKLMENYN